MIGRLLPVSSRFPLVRRENVLMWLDVAAGCRQIGILNRE